MGSRIAEVLRHFDAATAATRIRVPVHVAAALFDAAVPPPGQFAIYNARARRSLWCCRPVTTTSRASRPRSTT